MGKHTPGPWEIDGYYVTSDTLPRDWAIAKVLYNFAMTEQSEADHALIAAAPDLLEACEALAKWGTDTPGPDTLNLIQIIKKAQDAIAKAKGES